MNTICGHQFMRDPLGTFFAPAAKKFRKVGIVRSTFRQALAFQDCICLKRLRIALPGEASLDLTQFACRIHRGLKTANSRRSSSHVSADVR